MCFYSMIYFYSRVCGCDVKAVEEALKKPFHKFTLTRAVDNAAYCLSVKDNDGDDGH